MSVKVHKGLFIISSESAIQLNKILNLSSIKRLVCEKISDRSVAFLSRDKQKVVAILRKEGIGFSEN